MYQLPQIAGNYSSEGNLLLEGKFAVMLYIVLCWSREMFIESPRYTERFGSIRIYHVQKVVA